MQSLKIVDTFCIRTESLKSLPRAYLQLKEALSFPFDFLIDVSFLRKTKKKALVKSF